jgi:hypothetical protein
MLQDYYRYSFGSIFVRPPGHCEINLIRSGGMSSSNMYLEKYSADDSGGSNSGGQANPVVI